MTDARLGGLGREALVSAVSLLQAGGLAREALVSGSAVDGRISARSAGRATPTIGASGVALAGRIGASSRARLAQLPISLALAGRIGAQSRGEMTPRGVRVLQARALAASRARGALTQRVLGRQNAVSINVG